MQGIRGAAAIGVLALAAAAAGCGDDAVDGRAARSDLPPAVELMWDRPAEEVVGAGGPDPLLLPGPGLPDDAVLTEVVLPDPDDDARLPTTARTLQDVHQAAQTLYADPTAPDPATGRSLTVGRSEQSDTETGLILPGDGEPVELPVGDRGRIDRLGDDWLVSWDLPVEHHCGCTQEGFVLGRGVGRDAVLAAARRAEVLGPRPSVPAAAREGLRSLGTANGVGEQVPAAGPLAQSLTVRVPDGKVHLAVRTGDPRLVAHARVWAPEGTLLGLPARRVVVARDDGALVIATAWPPVSGADVEAVVAALVPAAEDEVTAAMARIDAEVPLEDCAAELPLGPPERSASFHGRTPSGGRWVVGVGYDGTLLMTCETVAAPGLPSSGAGGGGGATELDLAAPIELVSKGTVGGDGQVHRIVLGHVAAGTAEVEVVVPGRPPVLAQLAETGPADGRRWFAGVVEVTDSDIGRTEGTGAIARDAAGAELGRIDD